MPCVTVRRSCPQAFCSTAFSSLTLFTGKDTLRVSRLMLSATTTVSPSSWRAKAYTSCSEHNTQVTTPQRRVRPTQRNTSLEEITQVVIPAVFVARKSLAAIRVVPAVQADLVAIVNARRAGVGEHEQRRQAQRAFVATRAGDKARCVVAIKQVELGARHGRVIQSQQVVNRGLEFCLADGANVPVTARLACFLGTSSRR